MTFIGKTGRRDVPLSAAAAALFDRVAESKLPDAPLFAAPDGKPWKGFTYCKPVAAAVRAAGLPDETILYTLRHTFITECLTGGLSTLDVCRLVGTSLQMIEKHYGHLVMNAARERLAKVALL
jgi:integrase